MSARPIAIVVCLALVAGLAACASSGSSSGYRSSARIYGGYYGPRPYGYYGDRVVVVPPGPDIGGPVATPLPAPEPGFGDFGPTAGFDDFGGFDDF